MSEDLVLEGIEPTAVHLQETDILLEAENIALEAAKKFIHIQFKKPIEEFSHEELVDIINKQTNFAHSEVLETLDAFGINPVEELDGVADVFYTYPVLEYMIIQFNNAGVEEEIGTKVKLRRLQHTRALAQFVLQQTEYKAAQIKEAVVRVCENNLLKFTTDETEFNEWVVPEGILRDVTEIDGINYYFLADPYGKVRKREGFPSVELSDLAEAKEG